MARSGVRRTAVLTALIIGLIVGVGYPYVDLAVSCRVADSEACVWGKAYFPLTLVMSVVLLGGLAGGVVYAVLSSRRKNSGDDSDQ